MPVIKSVETIPDGGGGLRIITSDGEIIQATKVDLPAPIQNGTAQQIEDFVNNFLNTRLPTANYSFRAQIHVLTTTPLFVQTIVSNDPIPSNWFTLLH